MTSRSITNIDLRNSSNMVNFKHIAGPQKTVRIDESSIDRKSSPRKKSQGSANYNAFSTGLDQEFKKYDRSS